MKKRLIVGLLAGGLLAASASPVLAGPPSTYACPPGFTDVPVKDQVTGLVDRNDSAWICERSIGGGSGPVLHYIDDHPTGQPG